VRKLAEVNRAVPHSYCDTVISRADGAVGGCQFIGPVRFLCGVALCAVWSRTRSSVSPGERRRPARRNIGLAFAGAQPDLKHILMTMTSLV
jgi:hypothetical protein